MWSRSCLPETPCSCYAQGSQAVAPLRRSLQFPKADKTTQDCFTRIPRACLIPPSRRASTEVSYLPRYLMQTARSEQSANVLQFPLVLSDRKGTQPAPYLPVIALFFISVFNPARRDPNIPWRSSRPLMGEAIILGLFHQRLFHSPVFFPPA